MTNQNQTASTTAKDLIPSQYFGAPKLDIPKGTTLRNLRSLALTQSHHLVAEETYDPTTPPPDSRFHRLLHVVSLPASVLRPPEATPVSEILSAASWSHLGSMRLD